MKLTILQENGIIKTTNLQKEGDFYVSAEDLSKAFGVEESV